jgi:hypothetical protein
MKVMKAITDTRKVGRPRLEEGEPTVVIQVSLTARDAWWIREVAGRRHTSASAIIRQAAQAIAAYGRDAGPSLSSVRPWRAVIEEISEEGA